MFRDFFHDACSDRFEILFFVYQVLNLVKPIASVKRLQVNLTMGPDIPETAEGDDKRLLQTALNVVGNAVKFTKEGCVNVIVGLERPEYPRDPRTPEFLRDFRPTGGEQHFYLRVQVPRLPGLDCFVAFPSVNPQGSL